MYNRLIIKHPVYYSVATDYRPSTDWRKVAERLYNRYYRPAGERKRRLCLCSLVGDTVYRCQFGYELPWGGSTLDDAVTVSLDGKVSGQNQHTERR